MPMDRSAIGNRGEEVALEFLFSNGFNLLHRNWRNGRYELDLVAEKEGTLHIVEVKTRQADAVTSPESAMTRAKFRSLCQAAEYYIKLYGIESEVQFDLIAVEYAPDRSYEVRYIPDVMSSVW